MARCPFASWAPQGTTPGGPIKPRVAILHVTASDPTPGDDDAQPHDHLEWHFEIFKSGAIQQQVDTGLQADANYKANPFAISIETEGTGDGTWTDAQIKSILRLLVWLNQVHGIPLVVCKTWDGAGVGFHTMFGAPGPWTPVAKSCPGPNRKKQFWDIIVPALTTHGDAFMAALTEAEQKTILAAAQGILAANVPPPPPGQPARPPHPPVHMLHWLLELVSNLAARVDAIEAPVAGAVDVDSLAVAVVDELHRRTAA